MREKPWVQLQKNMYCNVGSLDRKVRIAFGLAIIILGFYFQSWLFLLGWIPLASGLLSFCPLYALLGLNTSKEREKFWH
ncbi:MAG TPA: DUF2892 domain-containing protein [Cytophagaceae bacterium]|jgi:hypothetical protein|nr:DUF2892 domain-containing protein [Cytophagaceae bacterium]